MGAKSDKALARRDAMSAITSRFNLSPVSLLNRLPLTSKPSTPGCNNLAAHSSNEDITSFLFLSGLKQFMLEIRVLSVLSALDICMYPNPISPLDCLRVP